MRKSSLLVAAAAALSFVVPVGAAEATPPSDVLIEIDTELGEFGGFGPFTASGSAVDDGLFCASGFSFDVFGKAAGGNEQGINFQVFKVLECDDESGAVVLKLQVRIDGKGNNYSWTVAEGFGAYERLHGGGKGSGEFLSETEIFDVLPGKMHID